MYVCMYLYYEMMDGVCLSISLSVCRVPRPKSRMERPINAVTDNASYDMFGEFQWLKGESESIFH